MSHSLVALSYLLVTFVCSIVGICLKRILPQSHFTDDSKDSIKVGVGLIATMSALVLGLITASAKNSFDAVDTAIRQSAAQILTLDRILARYGPETADIRAAMKVSLEERINSIWPKTPESHLNLDPMKSGIGIKAEELGDHINRLKPQNDDQKLLQAKAADLAEDILQERWLIFAGSAPSVSAAFVLILLFWLAITFLSFGLFAPNNGTVVVMFFICSLSVASSIFLILELDSPFNGFVKVSPVPMQYAVDHLNR